MLEVSKDHFFQAIGGPENIHPRSEPDHAAWEIVGSRQLVGKTTPGYKNPGSKPRRHFLTEEFAAKKGIRP